MERRVFLTTIGLGLCVTAGCGNPKTYRAGIDFLRVGNLRESSSQIDVTIDSEGDVVFDETYELGPEEKVSVNDAVVESGLFTIRAAAGASNAIEATTEVNLDSKDILEVWITLHEDGLYISPFNRGGDGGGSGPPVGWNLDGPGAPRFDRNFQPE